MIDYTPLWETMKQQNISTYRLLKDYGFSKGTLDSLKQNKNVTLNTIETLCTILNVPIEQIVRIVPDKDK
ncbi:MAG: helix-turn-helix transcriptional regulator [Lachnospiraceae bacterium]|nr:helix-turn-helix transcriptional regulator [Lachnospiraceae bacterium]